jgi:hypothetical protein
MRAHLVLARRKYAEFQTDVLPEGRGQLLHLLGQAPPPEDEESAPDMMKLPVNSVRAEQTFSLSSRRSKAVPNGHASVVAAPKMCNLNGVFDEMHRNLAVAEPLVRHCQRVRIPTLVMAELLQPRVYLYDLSGAVSAIWHVWLQELSSSRGCARACTVYGGIVH